MNLIIGLILITLAGWGLIKLIAPDIKTFSEQLAWAWLAGVGLVTFILFILSWAGLKLSQDLVFMVVVALIIIFLIFIKPKSDFLKPKPKWDFKSWIKKTNLLQKILFLVLLIAILTPLALNLYFPPRAYDTISTYNRTAILTFVEGTSRLSLYDNSHPGAVGSNTYYPPLVSLSQSLIYFFSGGQGPSKLATSFTSLAFIVLFFLALKRHTSWTLASLFSLFLLSTPKIFEQLTITYTNLPAAFFLGLAVIYFYSWLTSKSNTDLALTGLGLGLAAWTRLDALPFIGLIILFTAWQIWRTHRLSRPKQWLKLGWLIVPPLLTGALWQIFIRFVLPNAPTASNFRIFPVWEPERAVKILGDFLAMPFAFQAFGLTFFIFAAALVFSISRQTSHQKILLGLILSSFLVWYLMFYQLAPNFGVYEFVWGSPFSSASRVLLILAPPALFYSALRFHSIIKKTLLS
jgi:hypothetical protein